MESLSGKYVKQSLEKCDLLFVNVDENDDVRGFATIIFDELGIYIVVICSFALQRCQGSCLGERKVDLRDRDEHPRERSCSTAKEQKTTSDRTGTRNFISTNQHDLRKPTKARRGGEYGLCICIRLVSGNTLYNM